LLIEGFGIDDSLLIGDWQISDSNADEDAMKQNLERESTIANQESTTNH